MGNVGLIILAAGKSNRMGKPKQLLTYQGSSLISHAVKTGLNSICKPVIVVLGAYVEHIKPQINKFPVQIIENPYWKTGMSSSIHAGITVIKTSHPNLDAVIIALADQPLINQTVFNQLVQSYQETQNIIIASAYDDIIGVPALFDRSLFTELNNLEGDKGAKTLMRKYQDEILTINIPQAAIDIDTPDDYEKLLAF
ncbi:nucleotidyltransferase family protein [Rivularia sp. UHCC 0363]|uniref:nucleotidyltransferase family protein n=1 Tax=Rivularia sp. UHCC 0363 TaxID=3110244 RepID=UPI002B217095|nr:nucleotidyltransferase family protein [Rivularia sp. UHCC 0363]MEA5597856.1 nucleotidyltransferase family protein [Rivularia sp. UHCC 0363]